MSTDWTAARLRRTWTQFFADRGHVPMRSSGLVPHHPRAPLFTNAGMNQFLPWFLGEEPAAHPRTTTVQKCVRIMGKHDDIENIGRSKRHLTFFEMLGNWSFGAYFKAGAIELAYELVTEQLGFDPERLWITVHHTDDEAEQLWQELTPIPIDRIQRRGQHDDENFWAMGDIGPCGPCSEIHLDRGPEFGPEGGPAHGGDERYLEFWNLVFMQYDRQPDSSLVPLPKKNIDTGAGYERLLSILQGVDSVFDTDLFVPLVDRASELTSKPAGRDTEIDVSLRILADHARATTFLINDGVFPSNEERGYVLRRLIRRAVRRAYSLGVERPVMAELSRAVISQMGEPYPDLNRNADFITHVLDVEEGRFRSTLARGLGRLDQILATGARTISGDVSFELHDTFGFPVEVTREVAAEHGVDLDETGFTQRMTEQRERARASARKEGGDTRNADAYRELYEAVGDTEFLGDEQAHVHARVLAVLSDSAGHDRHVEIVLDRTSFYAEGGGQVGDTGEIKTPSGCAKVVDTTRAAGGLIRHHAEVLEGAIHPGEEAEAIIDQERRARIRRNHTGTHLLHWALRKVLGDHVKQQGSLVAPDELRFDFSHFGSLTPDEIIQVEKLVNEEVLTDHDVVIRQMTKAQADAEGIIAFFGEKYGDTVRVLDAGPNSHELCGGTHVRRLGQIGAVKVVKEESIASNTRRIYATTGMGTLELLRREEATMAAAAEQLKVTPGELPQAVEKLLAERRALERELKATRSRAATADAADLLASAEDGVVIARRDGLDPSALRDLALAVRDKGNDLKAVVLIGSPDGEKVTIVAAVPPGGDAARIVRETAPIVGGKGGGNRPVDVAQGGGRDPSAIDAALAKARELALEA